MEGRFDLEKKSDVRTIKTKSAITKAFWKLFTYESISKISIKQLINEAQVNRATFYKYYENKYDLLNKMETDLIDEFKKNTTLVPMTILTSDFKPNQLSRYYQELIQFIYKKWQKFSILLAPDGDPSFINKLVYADNELWQERHLTEHLSIPEHYVFSAVIRMAINLINEWIISDFKESPKEFLSIIEKIVIPVFYKNMLPNSVSSTENES